jgi:Fur family transcriptional regulator, ferric uptake regulator
VSARAGASLRAQTPTGAAATAAQTRDWGERARHALAGAGYRRGGARHALVGLLAEQRCALSVAEIESELAARDRAVSRASVYRILDELAAIGLVAQVDVGQGLVRYEPVHDSGEHHHHIVCESCGGLEPFADEALERAIRRLSERLRAQVHEHEIVLRGRCSRCA